MILKKPSNSKLGFIALILCIATSIFPPQYLASSQYIQNNYEMLGILPQDIAVNPTTNQVYVACRSSNNLLKIDGSANLVINSLSFEGSPIEVIINPINNLIFVSSNNYSIYVIDDASFTFVTEIKLDFIPKSIVVNPFTNKLYVLIDMTAQDFELGWNVLVYDLHDFSMITTIKVGAYSENLAINTALNQIYATNNENGTVVIDGYSDKVINTLPNCKGRILVNSLENKIYVNTWRGLSVFDGDTYIQIASIYSFESIINFEVDAKTNRIYLVMSEILQILDGNTGVIEAEIPYGMAHAIGNTSLAVNPNSCRVYITHPDSNAITVVDTRNNYCLGTIVLGENGSGHLETGTCKITKTIPLFSGPGNCLSGPGMIGSLIRINSVTNLVYVTYSRTSSVAVIDGNTNKVKNTIEVYGEPNDIEVDNIGNKIYISSGYEGIINVIDGVTNNIIDEYSIEFYIDGIALDPTGRKLYVTHQDVQGFYLTIIDTQTKSIIRNILIANETTSDSDIILNPQNNYIYVTARGYLTIVDANTTNILYKFKLPNDLHTTLSVNTKRNLLYIGSAGTIIVWDCSTNKILTEIESNTSEPPRGKILCSPEEDLIYAIQERNNSLSEISVNSKDSVRNFSFESMQGGSLYDMDMNLITNRIYLTLFENRIAVLDRTSFQLIENIIVGSSPTAIAENWKTNKLYVVNSDTDTVSVIDTKKNIVTKNIDVGTDPNCIAIDREMNRVFVATLKGIYVIDGSSDQIISIIKRIINNKELDFSIPHSMTFNPTTGLLYLLRGVGEGSIWVFDTKTNSFIEEVNGWFFTDNQIAINPITNKLYAQENKGTTFSPTIVFFESTPTGYKYTYQIDSFSGTLGEGIQIFNGTTKKMSRIMGIEYSPDVTMTRLPIVVDSIRNKIYYSPNPSWGKCPIFIIDGANDTSLNGLLISNIGTYLDLSLNEKESLLFVLSDNQLSIIDTNSETLQTSIVLPPGNQRILTDPITNIVYIANPYRGIISVIEDTSINSTPTAYFQYSINFSNNNQMLTCDGSLSYDPSGGNITSYNWDFGDGNQKTTTEPMVTHRYAISGKYKITLSVKNQNGLTNSFSNNAACKLAVSTNFGKTTGTGLYEPGSQLEIEVTPPTAVEGEKYLWDGWSGIGEGSYTGSDNPASIILNEDIKEVASWRKQFYLNIITDHGQIQGGGWYDQDSTATVSVTAQMPMDGLPGLLGGKIIFMEWQGDENSTEPVIQLFMDGKKNVSAVWKEDFGQYYNTLGIAGIILIAIAIFIFVFRRGARASI